MTTTDHLRAIAAHGVVGAPPSPIHLTAEEVPVLLLDASAHRLVGLLDQALADGLVDCDADGATRIGERAVEAASWSVRLERHLLVVHDDLTRRGIPHRFVKGATVAHRFYSHPALRMSLDVDVLILGAHLDDAVAALAASGHRRSLEDPYPGFSRRYAKSVTMRSADGVEVDVHRVIPDGPFGLRAGPEALWARPPAEVRLGGRLVPALDPIAAFVQAGVNAVASYDQVTLAAVRDVVQIGAAVADQVDEVGELASALGVRACLAEAVGRAVRDLGWAAPPAVAAVAAWPITTREREWLDSYRQPISDGRRALLSVQAVPGVLPKVAYVGSVAALLAGRPARRRARAGRPLLRRPGGPPR